MIWFKYFIISYFIIRAAFLTYKSTKETGRVAASSILAATLLLLTALGVYEWL